MKALEEGQKHSKEKKLTATKEDLRWATNELVADWRAERMKCDRIADVGCGIGLQAMSFAKKCPHVLAIDIDGEKIKSAKANAKKLNFKNIDFVEGDALDEKIHEKAKGCQAVFLDPERSESAKARSIDDMKPDIKEFLTWYSDITSSIAIEFPPQIKDIPLDCEKEYISINGKLNRLTLYFGGLRKCALSAVALPGNHRIERRQKVELEKCSAPKKHIYEVDYAVQKAGLVPELSHDTQCPLVHEKKYAFLTSDGLVESPFFRNRYRVLDAVEFDRKKILESLQRHQAGKAVVRYEVDPKEYWSERNYYEKQLIGKKELVLFDFDGLAVVCERIK